MGKVPNLTRVFPWEDSALARVTLALYQFTHSINIIRFYYCFVFQPEYLLLVVNFLQLASTYHWFYCTTDGSRDLEILASSLTGVLYRLILYHLYSTHYLWCAAVAGKNEGNRVICTPSSRIVVDTPKLIGY